MRKITLKADESGASLLSFLRKNGFSRRMITRLKSTDGVTVNDIVRHTDFILTEGDEISAVMTDEKTLEPNSGLVARVVYEDEDAVVFDKPWGMPTHPSVRHRTDTLGNLFAARYDDISFRPINRLDCDTSGLCLCAKNKFAASALAASFDKTYFAVCEGLIDGDGEIDAPIARESESIIKRIVRGDGQSAKTLYSAVSHCGERTLVRVKLLTGRTHQIRVHFSHIGHPLCGDDLYGGSLALIERQALHCGEISFTQPVTGAKICLHSILPQDIRRLLGTNNGSLC